jgi:hypothetical protein
MIVVSRCLVLLLCKEVVTAVTIENKSSTCLLRGEGRVEKGVILLLLVLDELVNVPE